MLIERIRRALNINPADDREREELAQSGWYDVLGKAGEFHWRVWFGPPARRLAWCRGLGVRNEVVEGSLRELLTYCLKPRPWSNRESVWTNPRRGVRVCH
ncbi:hypothetical protein KJ673_00115 [Patescibacteria group bacterium]|nr:hypothetical protein [Patescibacteria group bacterium]MBU4452643.1 hypothetical protein [Patescibacteria group bacterium]MCG2687390.1 hypothetical protein [Candidatus Parcubacteria bacterium]